MNTTTLQAWFDGFTKATNETPTHIVFGYDEWDDNEWEITVNEVIPFERLGSILLRREFNNGYGGNNSPNFCAWSENWVIFSDNYDGAEDACWVPRNPIAHNPIRPGGG